MQVAVCTHFSASLLNLVVLASTTQGCVPQWTMTVSHSSWLGFAGPRSFTFAEGARRRALEAVLSVAAVVMVTEGELEVCSHGRRVCLAAAAYSPTLSERAAVVLQALTGEPLALQGSTKLLHQYRSSIKWVVVKFGGRGMAAQFSAT